jgi:hypothetical protein
MQVNPKLQFACTQCNTRLSFSAFGEEAFRKPLACAKCGNRYLLNDKTLQHHLRSFEALCRQLRDSEEILSHSSVSVRIGDDEVKVPFRTLLTRFACSLDLEMDGKRVAIAFDVEP